MSLKSWVKRTPRAKRFALFTMRMRTVLRPAGLVRLPRFFSDWWRFRSAGGSASPADFHPCLFDRTATTGVDHQYFYQAVWAMKRIASSGAKHHVDVGSQVSFVGMLTAITDVTFVDIRPLAVEVERLTMKPGSILELPFENASLHSLSSLHVIEHIGLGRYGDPIDPHGLGRAAVELQRVLAPRARLYISTPIGRTRVQFNSQRISDPRDVVALFDQCRLAEFSAVDFAGNYRENVPVDTNLESVAGNDFGLGMFVFEKIQ